MEIITGMDFRLQNSSVSLGKFDGVHKGHRYLLSNIQKKSGLVSTVFTFGMEGISRIYTQEEKDRVLEKLGVEREIIFPFTRETKCMLPEEFIDKILIGRLDAKYVCVGEDFRFGKDRAGDIRTLEQWKEKYGYTLSVVKKLTCQSEIVSSSKIRSMLESGEMDQVNRFLEEPYFIQGTVLTGERLGRKLDAPTANLMVPQDKILPRFGVYVTTAEIGEKRFQGVTNVGVKPTVGDFPAGVETHLFSFNDILYEKKMYIYFHKFLRPEIRFSSMEQLKSQIEKDKKEALEFFQQHDRR